MIRYQSVYNTMNEIMIDMTNSTHVIRIRSNDLSTGQTFPTCISIEDAESFIKDIQANIQICKERKLIKLIT